MSTDKKLSRDEAVAEICRLIVGDALSVFDLIETAVANGAAGGNELTSANVMVARMGMLADSIFGAFGGSPYRLDPMEWMTGSGRGPDAIRTLAGQADAASLAQGGAA